MSLPTVVILAGHFDGAGLAGSGPVAAQGQFLFLVCVVVEQVLAGLLCDGRVRDFGDLARQEPVVYSVGETARWGGDVLMPFKANCPVIVGGVTIIPGDYIYADASGAVILPATPVDQILDEAARIEQNGAQFIKHIRDEDRERVLKNDSGES